MPETLIAALLAFAGTNVDDLFINMLYFALADTRHKVRHVVAGKYLGFGVLFLLSLAGASLLHALPVERLNLLGVVPIALGIRAWLHRQEDASRAAPSASGGLLLSTALVTIANGADNIGVYMPLLAEYATWQIVVTGLVFALLTAVWCMVSSRFSSLPALRGFLQRHKSVIAPAVLIALGTYILI